jgi:hypothetical protein
VGIRSLGDEPAPEPLGRYDLVVAHALHSAYADIAWAELAPVLLDARNAFSREAVEAAGVRYLGIGRPASPD